MTARLLRVVSRVGRVVPLRIAVLVAVLVALIGGPATTGAARAPASLAAAAPCQFQQAAQPLQVAFCDSFDHGFAQVNGSREGTASGLDPQTWGVSRLIAGGGAHFQTGTNPSQGTVDSFAPVTTTANDCGGSQTVVPDGDVEVCGGTLFDSVNDDGGQTVLAMYPKQPFNIAGRTGTVTFNVSDNSQGIHAAWPTFVYTDQPVPAPYSEASGIQPSARNSFGITFAQYCNQASNQYCVASAPGSQADCPNTNDVTVDTMFETQNYSLSPVRFTTTGCVAEASQAGQQNHVEITISASTIKVYMSNPGSSSLIEVAEADNANVPLTNGLVWMEDNHYNADKFNSQQSNTFAWSDLGFDGPIEPRDVGYDAPNSGILNGAAERLGWSTGAGSLSPVTVTAPGVSSQALSQASGALAVFNWFPVDSSVPSISVNGNPLIATPWPFSNSSTGGYGGNNDDTYVWRTMAVKVPLAEIRAGDNAITFENAPNGLANVSLILQGAGGVPSCLDPSNCGAATNPSPSPSTGPSTDVTSTPTPKAGGPNHFDHVITFMEENHAADEVGNSSMPFLQSMAAQGARAGNYFAVTHPSLPNYLDLTSGNNGGITTDCAPPPNPGACSDPAKPVSAELEAAGLTWAAYAQSASGPCDTTDASPYAARHNPFLYYTQISGADCRAHDLPLSSMNVNNLPNYAFIIPDLNHDAHDGTLGQADQFLQQEVTAVRNGQTCQKSSCLVIVTWDEDDSTESNQVSTVFDGPGVPAGYVSNVRYTHYSLLRTIEDNFGVGPLGQSAGAQAMDDMISAPGPTPTPTSTPTPTPTRAPTPTPTPGPSPQNITNVPCTVTINGQPQSGTCSGTFTAG